MVLSIFMFLWLLCRVYPSSIEKRSAAKNGHTTINESHDWAEFNDLYLFNIGTYIWNDLSHTKSIAISRSIAIWIGSPGQNDFSISFKVGYHDPIPRNFTLPHLHSSNSYDLIKGHLNTLNPVHSFTLLDHHHYYYCWDGNIHSFTTYRGSSSPERVTCGNLSIHGSCKLSLFLSFCTFRIFA